MVFGENLKILTTAKRIPSERASPEEQNGTDFRSIGYNNIVAPSSEQLWVRKEM